jgi:hypothetical protein
VSDAKGVIEERMEERAKIFEAPPCAPERFITDRKAPAYLGFSRMRRKKNRQFIGNSSPSVSMQLGNETRGSEKAKVVASDATTNITFVRVCLPQPGSS